MTAVAVCIPTYRRPEQLAALLASLVEHARDEAHVIVVDNDPAGSAERIVRPYMDFLPGLIFEVETEPGISAARNRLVSLARSLDVEYVAFLDDDQIATPNWLSNLVATAKAHCADAVAGPIVPVYPDVVPRWIVTGGFFERPRYTTGTRIRATGVGNVMLKLDALAELEGPFERRFGLTGGEDAHALEQLRRRGIDVIWCDEAVVHEAVAPARAKVSWLLRRALRSGATYSASLTLLDPRPSQRSARALRCGARLFQGIAMLPLSLPRGRAAAFGALVCCSTALGGLAGLAGFRYEEYGRAR